MDSNTPSVDFQQVKDRELQEIVKRRYEAGLLPRDERDGEREKIASQLVGLSFSGGGIRSASFNLGLLQALYDKKLLRHVDYLSTVSGGGYTGACFSSIVLHPDTRLEWEVNGTRPSGGNSAEPNEESPQDAFPLAQGAGGRQPPRVQELEHGGAFLDKPLLFLNRWLTGVFLIGLVTFTGVLAVAALTAYLYRKMDDVWMMDLFDVLGSAVDIDRAFFPCKVCFGGWLLAWLVAYWRRGKDAAGKVARIFLVLTIITFLLALAALVGTGDIDFNYLKKLFGYKPPKDEVSKLQEYVQLVFIVILAVSLLPYLRPRELIRSGTHPKNPVEGWIFAIASRGLLYGLPLVLFAWMARENISHYNEKRFLDYGGIKVSHRYDLQQIEFPEWAETWRTIESLAENRNELCLRLRDEANRTNLSRVSLSDSDETLDPADRTLPPISKSLLYHEKYLEFERSIPTWRRWFYVLSYPFERQNRLIDQLHVHVGQRLIKDAICQHLSDTVLRDPMFYKAAKPTRQIFDDVPAAEREDRLKRLDALIKQGEQLGKSAVDLGFSSWLRTRGARLRELRAAEESKDLNKKEQAEEVKAARASLRAVLNERQGQMLWLEEQISRVNWSILKTCFGDQLEDKEKVFATIVQPQDQKTRWSWFVWSAVIFLILSCLVNLNVTSLHGFYRDELARIWVTSRPGMGRVLPLARLETTAQGAPYHILCATLNLIGRRDARAKSPTDIFIFSQAFCGSEHTGYLPTERFSNGRYELADAMAISGAALSPTYPRNPLLAFLLLLMNLRMGQWLPNPGHRPWLPKAGIWLLERWPATPLRLLFGAFQSPEHRYYCFVTDGGHVENLGLEQLLLRRCRLILVSDVSSDPNYTFSGFLEVVRRVRSDRGIQIRSIEETRDGPGLGLEKVIPRRESRLTAEAETRSFAAEHFVLARIEYPEGPLTMKRKIEPDEIATPSRELENPQRSNEPTSGILIYIKPSFTSDEDADLLGYWAEHPEFPHDPTSDQFYDADKFEVYRRLGDHIGNRLCEALAKLKSDHPDLHEVLKHWPPESKPLPVEGIARRRSTTKSSHEPR